MGRFSTLPPQFADYGYDTVRIVKECGTDTKCYRERRDGASGVLAFDESNRRTGAYEEKELRGGVFLTIRTIH